MDVVVFAVIILILIIIIIIYPALKKDFINPDLSRHR